MKTKPIYLFLSLALSCACSSDEELSTVAHQPCNALELTVSASGFVTDSSTPGTRAIDNGTTTTFENNDRVGVIVLEDGALKGNNLPYKYNGSSWSFDATKAGSESSGKSVYYYDDKATNVTYIVYFPYSTNADNVTSIDGVGGLKSKITPKEDQQSESGYRASDLMVWTSGSGSPQKKLAATLAHAYNSVSLLPEVHYTLVNGTDCAYPPPAISDVNFIMDDKIVYPYKAADSSYRCILPSGLRNNSVRCFYTVDNKTYSKDLTVSSTGANTRYSSTQKINAGTYSLEMVQVGDFYCRSSDGSTGYLIPKYITSLTEDQQKDCVGVVYWLGDIKSHNYGLLDAQFSSGTHGLVVALWDMPAPDNGSAKMAWTYGASGDVSNWLGSAIWSGAVSRPEDFTSIQARDRMQGYANTVALEEYNKYIENPDNSKDQNLRVKPVKGLAAFQAAHPAPTSSSGWYWPSKKELEQVCWGQNSFYKINEINGRRILNTQFGKVGGTVFGYDSYWSSTESISYSWATYGFYAFFVRFEDGYCDDSNQINSPFRVRPLLAF